MPEVMVPWEEIDAFVAADRQFVAVVRDAAARLRAMRSPPAGLEDWLALRVPEMEWRHQRILEAYAELRSPAPRQSVDWLMVPMAGYIGFRQGLDFLDGLAWNRRLGALLDASQPDGATALKEAVSRVSAAGRRFDSTWNPIRRARHQDDLFQGRKMYAENDYWFWDLREESDIWDGHVWNGIKVPFDAPTRAAAIYFAGEADGYHLEHSVPMNTGRTGNRRMVRPIYGSLLGSPEERRRRFTRALDEFQEDRAVLTAELYQGRLPLLSDDEGIFGAWWLIDRQYSELQQLCEAHNWPKDLWIESTPWWRRKPPSSST